MNLKKRILIASAVMVLISLVLMLFVGGNVIHWFSRGDRADTVIVDDALVSVSHIICSFDSENGSWQELSDSLALDGYELAAIEGDTVVFSSLGQDYDSVIGFATEINWGPDVSSINVSGVTVVGRHMDTQKIIAMTGRPKPVPVGNGPPIMATFVLYCLMAIAPILIVSQIFTNRVSKNITQPLFELTQAVRRVERGDLAKPVLIRGRDEFAEVCETFNNLQLHLLTEREKNAAYEKARTDLISGISHDLRTPLTSIKGYIKGLKDGVAGTPEKQAQYLEIAYDRSRDMEKLIARLLDFSRLETGNIPVRKRPVKLHEFLEGYVSRLAQETVGQAVSVEMNSAEGEHLVMLDTELMKRVLVNLFDNSVKYAAAQPLCIKLSVWHEGRNEVLRFTDNGCGLLPGQLAHVFEEFWRGDESRSTKHAEGSGLGLYIVKYIVEAHGGTVHASVPEALAIEMRLPCAMETENENTNC